MRSDTAFREVRVANSDIADVVVLTNQTFQLVGKTNGRTNVVLYDADNQLVDIIEVKVNYDLKNLRRNIYESFPGEDVEVREMAGGIFLSGNVRDSDAAESIMKIAEAYAPEQVTNGLSIRDSHQVMLEVRFVEASRDVIKNLGIGLLVQNSGQLALENAITQMNTPPARDILSTLGGGTASSITGSSGIVDINMRIDALEENGVIRTLAEPSLVAMSGETASFLAGGEFPVPVAQEDDRVTIEFRQFGVGLGFTPTVLDDGVINLKVAPEVSQIDPTNAVRFGNIEVPALTVRRANTTVELRNSQSFAMAGLLQNNLTNSKTQVPWLGDVPVLGTLFKSSRYRKEETELVIIITPRLVQPASDIRDLATPLDNISTASDTEFFIGGQMEAPKDKNKNYSIPNSIRDEQSSTAARNLIPNSSTRTSKAGLSAKYGYALQ